MKAKSMMLMMIALGCGLVAAIGISQVIVQGGDADAGRIETDKILVAVNLIDIAEPLTEENAKLEEWPSELIPEGAIKTLEEVEGKYCKSRVVKGMAIVNEMLVDDKWGVVPTIPEGFRVTSMKVTVDEALAGLLQPGDRVDITGYFRQGDESVAKTFLHNVQVFAVNEKTERIIDPEGKALMAKTVSMLVTPEQVKTLLVAKRSGNLHLSLRSHDDETEVEDNDVVTLADILNQPSERASETREPEENNDSGLQDWLSQMSAPAIDPFANQPKMLLITGDGSFTEYQFSNDRNAPPQVVRQGSGMSAAVPPSVLPSSTPMGGGDIGGSGDPSAGDDNNDHQPDDQGEEENTAE